MGTGSEGPLLDVSRLAAVRATGLLDTQPEEIFDGLAQLAASLLAAPYAFITLVDNRRSFWKSRIGITDPDLAELSVEDSFCQYVIASGEPLIVGDVTADPQTADNPAITSMGVAAWAGYPLQSPEGLTLGSFCVVDTEVRTWSPRDVEVLRVLSQAAGRELALREAVANARHANDQLTMLIEVGQALSETLEVEEAVARLARLSVPLLGDWSVVSVVGGDGALRDLGWWHADEADRPVLDTFVGERLVGMQQRGATHRSLQSLRPVLVPDNALEHGLDVLSSAQARDAFRALKPESYAIFPLLAGDKVGGILSIVRGPDRPPMTAAEAEVAAVIAQRAGVALDNARLYAEERTSAERLHAANQRIREANLRIREAARHDHAVARALQNALLPRLPEAEHLVLAGRYRTADSADQVGGDWYDAILPADGSAALMIGDVAGHDIAAAAVMGQLRNMLRAFAWSHSAESPAELIHRLDRAMLELGITTMATLVVARIEPEHDQLDCRSRVLRWASAGHLSPVLLTPDGTPTLLEGQPGRPLAVDPSAPRYDQRCRIEEGSTLLFYTDGLVENREQEVHEGQDRLLSVLSARAGLALDDLLDEVLTATVGDNPADDVALLGVRIRTRS